MKLQRKAFLSALDLAGGLASKGSTFPFVVLAGKALTAQDSHRRVRVELETDETTEPVAYGCDSLRRRVAALTDEIVTIDTKKHELRAGKSRFKLEPTTQELGRLHLDEEHAWQSIDGDAFAKLLGRALPFAYQGEDRPQYRCILLPGDGSVQATDGDGGCVFRGAPNGRALLSPSAAKVITSVARGPARIAIGPVSIAFESGPFRFETQQLTGETPTLSNVADPKSATHELTTSRNALAECLATAVVASDSFLDARRDCVTLSGELRVSVGPDLFDGEVLAEGKLGGDISLAAPYLIRCLRAMAGENVTIRTGNQHSPTQAPVYVVDGDDYAIAMPRVA